MKLSPKTKLLTHVGRFHPLVLEVANSCELGTRSAQKIVNVMFTAIVRALRRHESVLLPIGTLEVVPNAVRPYRRWCRGQPTEFYRKQYRVELNPDVLESE
jgi:nucleoid DNA-binding protein